MLFLETLGPFFSCLRFSIKNKPENAKSVTEVLCCVSAVCSSRLNGRRGVQREVIYGKLFCH